MKQQIVEANEDLAKKAQLTFLSKSNQTAIATFLVKLYVLFKYGRLIIDQRPFSKQTK